MTLHIAAYRGNVHDPRALAARAKGMTLLRADRVYGRDHLVHAATLAARAIAEGRARAADVQTETLLYAAGGRQIAKALDFIGLREGTTDIAIVAHEDPDPFARSEGWVRDDALLAGGPHVLDAFAVTLEERAMLAPERWGDLILERVALVDVLKA